MMLRKDLLTIVIALCVAGYLAMTLGFVAHDDLGFSREKIRAAAALSAILLGLLLVIDYLGKKLRRAK
ncbi:hypothetical protein [Bradyrhizobium canariense]|uniref:Uncharacterized protein n=1 Tax=Bradyrhizobium canariense TaxID=255045 RepID=A0A1H1MU01_9BRAD|nr:hypothetical protein [Bradyrhizobium canariense]SDR90062.1 hypothetical protein SAMN05444158_0357 [Bradyrhizobium canariense]